MKTLINNQILSLSANLFFVALFAFLMFSCEKVENINEVEGYENVIQESDKSVEDAAKYSNQPQDIKPENMAEDITPKLKNSIL